MIVNKISIITTVFLIFLFSCNNQKNNLTENNDTSFNILNDITNFSEKLNNYDTLKILINTSLCMSSSFEHLVITKINDSIFIKGEITRDYISNSDKILTKKYYNYQKTDTLNLENLFQYLDEFKSTTEDLNLSFKIIASFKKDTIYYQSNDINGFNFVNYHNLIMNRLYPEIKHFKLPDIEIIEENSNFNFQ